MLNAIGLCSCEGGTAIWLQGTPFAGSASFVCVYVYACARTHIRVSLRVSHRAQRKDRRRVWGGKVYADLSVISAHSQAFPGFQLIPACAGGETEAESGLALGRQAAKAIAGLGVVVTSFGASVFEVPRYSLRTWRLPSLMYDLGPALPHVCTSVIPPV